LHIPKTAGSTFQFILENSFGIRACHTNHTKHKLFDQKDFEFARKFFPGLRSIAGHNLINPTGLDVPNPFFMTFLREPVARVISQFQDGILVGKSTATFEAALSQNEDFENLHVKLIAGERNLDKAKRLLEQYDFVGLTEKFDLSLDVLDKLCPVKLNLNYKRKRSHPDNTIKKSVEKDERLKEMAREKNRLDIELYSFAVNEIFPRCCGKAGFNPLDHVESHEKYTSEIRPKFLLCQLYNMLFYRQINKLIRRRNAA
jgi:hypothetical protein